MKPELLPETRDAIIGAAQALSGERMGLVHINQSRICDHCKDANKEAFPYHVTDEEGRLWKDLCNECFNELMRKYFGEDEEMKIVLLYTKDGGFVVSGKVPAFDVPPDVIIWGDRHFQYSATNDEGVDTYVECFAVALVVLN